MLNWSKQPVDVLAEHDKMDEVGEIMHCNFVCFQSGVYILSLFFLIFVNVSIHDSREHNL